MHMKNSAIFKETSLVFPSRKMVQIMEKLCNKSGKYTGEGLNDHDDHFTCYMDIEPVINNDGVQIRFKTVDKNGTINNEEHTLIALNTENIISLWTLNNSFHTYIPFEFRDHKNLNDEKEILIFSFGETRKNINFREEISIELYHNGNIGYNYYWGFPNGEFLARTNSLMKKIE